MRTGKEVKVHCAITYHGRGITLVEVASAAHRVRIVPFMFAILPTGLRRIYLRVCASARPDDLPKRNASGRRNG